MTFSDVRGCTSPYVSFDGCRFSFRQRTQRQRYGHSHSQSTLPISYIFTIYDTQTDISIQSRKAFTMQMAHHGSLGVCHTIAVLNLGNSVAMRIGQSPIQTNIYSHRRRNRVNESELFCVCFVCCDCLFSYIIVIVI